MEFLQDDEFCALCGKLLDAVGQTLHVRLDVSGVVLLDDSYFHCWLSF
jgi:hypothetical protein